MFLKREGCELKGVVRVVLAPGRAPWSESETNNADACDGQKSSQLLSVQVRFGRLGPRTFVKAMMTAFILYTHLFKY